MPTRPPTHKPQRLPAPDGRPSSARRGYGSTWRRLRLLALAAHPVCRHCGREEATEVDHQVALAAGGSNDLANLVPLCKRCHSRKTCLLDGGLGRERRGRPSDSGST